MITLGRSREGAWIEICKRENGRYDDASRSREGAWIEMALTAGYNLFRSVAPVRERGLKLILSMIIMRTSLSLP